MTSTRERIDRRVRRWLVIDHPGAFIAVFWASVAAVAIAAAAVTFVVGSTQIADANARYVALDATVATTPIYRGGVVADVTYTDPTGVEASAEIPVPTDTAVGDQLRVFWDRSSERIWFGADGALDPVSDSPAPGAWLAFVLGAFVGFLGFAIVFDALEQSQHRWDARHDWILDGIADAGDTGLVGAGR